MKGIKNIAKVECSTPYNVEEERKNLNAFLENRGLHLDPVFLSQISAGDIIEIYSVPDNKQIFRNNEFSLLCSYTAEQMSTIPFPQLFWRDDAAHLTLMQRASSVVLEGKKCVPWNLDPHELIESLHPRKRTFEIHMGWISPCFDSSTGACRAWASTLKVKFIFEWMEDVS